jgi:hypothetical protein
VAGCAKPPGGVPGGNGFSCGPTIMAGANLTWRGGAATGSGKSRKRTAGGRPLGHGRAGCAVGSLQALSLVVETLSVLSPICSAK